MSLINDALKRADAQKEPPPEPPQASPPVATTPAATTPVAPTPVAPTPVATRLAVLPRRRAGLWMAVAAGTVVILGAAALGWFWHDRGGAGPQQAVAAQDEDAIAADPADDVESPEEEPANPALAAVPTAPAAPVAGEIAAGPDTAKGGGLRAELWAAIPGYSLIAADAVGDSGAMTPSDAIAENLDALAVGDNSPSGTAPDTAIGLTPPPIGAGPDYPAPREAPGPEAKPGTADAPRAAQTAFDPSKYRVSSIVVSAAGGTALINGRPVGVGDSLGSATVVAITARTVEVECGGQRWTLRM
jgi:hypothetical protein